jgi:hypothetical protein
VCAAWGPGSFAGITHLSAAKQLLKAGLVRSSIKRNGSRLLSSTAAYEP